ncbi:MAG: hypothetical protein HOP36_07405 [Methyloglobulus sp.]|nr:hypothetical protein [Methyloglobulus sp.]
MNIENGKFKYLELSFVAFLLLLAVVTRLIAISHEISLDWSVYEKVLKAYFRTPSRTQVFLVQFSGFFGFAALFPIYANKEIKAFMYAFILFILVSVLRYIIPTFMVSVIGDLLASLFVLNMTRSFKTPKIAIALQVIAILILAPLSLWLVGLGMLRF